MLYSQLLASRLPRWAASAIMDGKPDLIAEYNKVIALCKKVQRTKIQLAKAKADAEANAKAKEEL